MRGIFLKDMSYHRARMALTTFAISALVMLILLLGGIMNGLRWQARRYPEFTGADIWVSSERSGGVFVGFSMLNPEYVEPVLRDEGLDRESLSPLIFAQVQPIIRGKETKAVVVGYKIGKMGGPTERDLVAGRLFTPGPERYAPDATPPPAEVVVSEIAKLEIGETLELWGEQFRVVGKVKNLFFMFDTPFIFMDIFRASRNILKGTIYVNCYIAKVKPGYSPEEVAARLDKFGDVFTAIEVSSTEQTVKTILRNYVDNPMKGVQFLRFMLWLASGLIVSMITYVTTLEKTQEIGILKAIGASNGFIISMTMKQVLLISGVGLTIGVLLARLAVYAFPIFVLINWKEAALVAGVTLIVCSAGGYWAARRVMFVDPMIAFRGELEG
jgi:putative ABC transport system permease protein